jgi:hypothetical protein
MSVVFPNSNLPTSSQPWAREVTKQLSNIIGSSTTSQINNSARDNQLNSSIVALTNVVNEVKVATATAQEAADAAAEAAEEASAAADSANAAIDGLTGLGGESSTYTLNVNNITSGTARDNTLNLSTANASINLFNGGVNINGPSAQIQVGTSGNGGTNVEGAVTFKGALFGPGMNAASTNTANVRRNTGTDKELVHTNQSSIRFKKDVVDLFSVEELNPNKLLELPVRAFRYKEDYPIPETDPRYGQLMPGFIAEEVDEVYPIGADREDGGSNIVESWNERMIIPGMLALIQELYKRIEILEGDKVE